MLLHIQLIFDEKIPLFYNLSPNNPTVIPLQSLVYTLCLFITLKDTYRTDSRQLVLQIKNFYLKVKLVLSSECYHVLFHQQISLS